MAKKNRRKQNKRTQQERVHPETPPKEAKEQTEPKAASPPKQQSSRRNRRSKSRYKQREQRQQMILYGGMAVVLLAVVGFIAYNILNAPPEVAEARLEQEPIQGNTQSAVQVVEYGAYGCPSCRSVHESGILDQIIENYGDRISFTFRNFPVIHPNDPNAAEAAQCAFDQGNEAFWAYHNAMYSTPLSEYGRMGNDEFITLANDLGLDGDTLSACLDGRQHQRTVDHWDSQSRRAGVRGTPTFFVNGRLTNAGRLEAAIVSALGS